MLVHCWVEVVNGGLAVNEHLVSVSYVTEGDLPGFITGAETVSRLTSVMTTGETYWMPVLSIKYRPTRVLCVMISQQTLHFHPMFVS